MGVGASACDDSFCRGRVYTIPSIVHVPLNGEQLPPAGTSNQGSRKVTNVTQVFPGYPQAATDPFISFHASKSYNSRDTPSIGYRRAYTSTVAATTVYPALAPVPLDRKGENNYESRTGNSSYQWNEHFKQVIKMRCGLKA